MLTQSLPLSLSLSVHCSLNICIAYSQHAKSMDSSVGGCMHREGHTLSLSLFLPLKAETKRALFAYKEKDVAIK